jgi:ER-bound oxygenase mpaB/B'/Rubber oxygenase, catalytic domain
MTSSVNPMLFSDEEFARFRHLKDDFADKVACDLMYFVKNHGIMHQALGMVNRNDDMVQLDKMNLFVKKKMGSSDRENKTEEENQHIINEIKTLLDNYFNDMTHFQFTEEENEILTKATTFFSSHMTEATLALAARSLLKQYAAFNSTQVLVFTQLFPLFPHRRLISTMQFVVDVMDENSFKPRGFGIRAIQKLRLIHALIRHRILNSDLSKMPPFNKKDKNNSLPIPKKSIEEKWNIDVWGEPINQQDMIFAIHTFSIEVLQGLIASGIEVSEEEIQNYYKAWHIIGRALGVLEVINPTDFNIGLQLQNRIYDKEFVPNENAKLLAEPLIQFMDDILPLTNRGSILGIVKLFNDQKDYEKVFKNIHGIDLTKSKSYAALVYKIAHKVGHWWLRSKYKVKKRLKKNYTEEDMEEDIQKNIGRNQHKIFKFIIGLEKTWTDNHFRISDGFGQDLAKTDFIEHKKRLPLWKRILNRWLPSFMDFRKK